MVMGEKRWLWLLEGKEKKAAANKQRKEFYNTEDGKSKKEYYADKARKKHLNLIRELKKIKTSRNDADLAKETIAKLMAMLQNCPQL